MSDDPSRTPPPDDEDGPRWEPFGPEAGESSEPEPPSFEPPRPPEWGRGADVPSDRPAGPATPPPPPPPVPPPVAPSPPPARRTPGKATAALVFGIAGLFVLPIVCSVVAIVLGMQARREIDADPSLGGRGSAQAGVVLGVIGILAFLLYIALGLPGVGGVGTGL